MDRVMEEQAALKSPVEESEMSDSSSQSDKPVPVAPVRPRNVVVPQPEPGSSVSTPPIVRIPAPPVSKPKN